MEFDFEDTYDISCEMEDVLPAYKYGELYEVYGGVLTPAEPQLVTVADAKFAEPLKCTDNLMNMIVERLPKPVR